MFVIKTQTHTKKNQEDKFLSLKSDWRVSNTATVKILRATNNHCSKVKQNYLGNRHSPEKRKAANVQKHQ